MHDRDSRQGRPRVLFVCTGNTCRSAMAEAIARHALMGMGLSVDVASAGTAAMDGAVASDLACQVASEAGLDLLAHRARRLQREALHQADLVLVMGEEHRQAVRALRRDAPVFLLGEHAEDSESEVPDPFGQDLDVYRQTFARIRWLVERSMRRFQQHLARGRVAAPPGESARDGA